jgi:hypothetical protein
MRRVDPAYPPVEALARPFVIASTKPERAALNDREWCFD